MKRLYGKGLERTHGRTKAVTHAFVNRKRVASKNLTFINREQFQVEFP